MTGEGDRGYPIVHKLGGVEVTLQLMGGADRDAVLKMARALPPHDLLFLRRDITSETLMDQWLDEIARGEITTVLATTAEGVVGYGTVHRSLIPWTSHVAELRVLVAESMRGCGLGRILTNEAFRIAMAEGIEKLTAQMTTDQEGAITTFTTLGFKPEAVLRGHVKDREGRLHDLLVLGNEVSEYEARHAAYGVTDALANAAS